MTQLIEFLTSFPFLVAISLGLAALIGNWMTARTNRLNAIAQREWEKEKWSREQTASAYQECLRYLSESRHMPFRNSQWQHATS